MRVGVYIDGLNLYYGGRQLCGPGRPGWRWLDLTGLVGRLVARNQDWSDQGAVVRRVVYCTSLIIGDPEARARQQTYLSVLSQDPLITIEEGTFRIRNVRGESTEDGVGLTVRAPEEKGSDVNVASHLLIDLHTDAIDAAIIVTNDSDLRFPAQHARRNVPTGTVNPRGRFTAKDLLGDPTDGCGGHWWYRLIAADFYDCQLPASVDGILKPPHW